MAVSHAISTYVDRPAVSAEAQTQSVRFIAHVGQFNALSRRPDRWDRVYGPDPSQCRHHQASIAPGGRWHAVLRSHSGPRATTVSRKSSASKATRRQPYIVRGFGAQAAAAHGIGCGAGTTSTPPTRRTRSCSRSHARRWGLSFSTTGRHAGRQHPGDWRRVPAAHSNRRRPLIYDPTAACRALLERHRPEDPGGRLRASRSGVKARVVALTPCERARVCHARPALPLALSGGNNRTVLSAVGDGDRRKQQHRSEATLSGR